MKKKLCAKCGLTHIPANKYVCAGCEDLVKATCKQIDVKFNFISDAYNGDVLVWFTSYETGSSISLGVESFNYVNALMLIDQHHRKWIVTHKLGASV